MCENSHAAPVSRRVCPVEAYVACAAGRRPGFVIGRRPHQPAARGLACDVSTSRRACSVASTHVAERTDLRVDDRGITSDRSSIRHPAGKQPGAFAVRARACAASCSSASSVNATRGGARRMREGPPPWRGHAHDPDRSPGPACSAPTKRELRRGVTKRAGLGGASSRVDAGKSTLPTHLPTQQKRPEDTALLVGEFEAGGFVVDLGASTISGDACCGSHGVHPDGMEKKQIREPGSLAQCARTTVAYEASGQVKLDRAFRTSACVREFVGLRADRNEAARTNGSHRLAEERPPKPPGCGATRAPRLPRPAPGPRHVPRLDQFALGAQHRDLQRACSGGPPPRGGKSISRRRRSSGSVGGFRTLEFRPRRRSFSGVGEPSSRTKRRFGLVPEVRLVRLDVHLLQERRQAREGLSRFFARSPGGLDRRPLRAAGKFLREFLPVSPVLRGEARESPCLARVAVRASRSPVGNAFLEVAHDEARRDKPWFVPHRRNAAARK